MKRVHNSLKPLTSYQIGILQWLFDGNEISARKVYKNSTYYYFHFVAVTAPRCYPAGQTVGKKALLRLKKWGFVVESRKWTASDEYDVFINLNPEPPK